MNKNLPSHHYNFLLYTAADGKVKVDVYIQDETVWLTQKLIGQIFGVESHTITYHLKEIFSSGELNEEATTRKIRAVQNEGKRQVSRKQQDSVCANFAPTDKTINPSCRGFLDSSIIGSLQ